MSDFEQLKENAKHWQRDDPAALMEALNKFLQRGYADDPLTGYYNVWQRSGGTDPNQFVEEMKKLIPQLGYRGEPVQSEEQPLPGNPRIQAGPPKWPGWPNVLKKL